MKQYSLNRSWVDETILA